MTREEEIALFTNFRNNYKNFPNGVVEYSDKPDVLIHCDNKVIGIELTEVFQDLNEGKESKLKAIEFQHNKIGQEIVEGLQKHTNLYFQLI